MRHSGIHSPNYDYHYVQDFEGVCLVAVCRQPTIRKIKSSGRNTMHVSRLTVDHLHDAAGAREPVGELVAGGDDVTTEGAGRHGLVCFGGSAGRVEEVPSNVVRVDAAGAVVVRCTVERMHVKAALGNHAVWVGHVIGIAEEELEVALVCVGIKDNSRNGG